MIEIGFSGEGYYTVQRLRDGDVVEELSFKNLILDNGINQLMGTPNVNPFVYARVGTGTTPEAVSQTSLTAQVSNVARLTATSSVNSTDRYVELVSEFVWSVGAVVGNLSEVGIGSATTGATLFSRSLVRDINGNPTSISVLADEQLRLIYKFRLYQPTSDMFTGTVGGYAVVMRAAQVNSWAINTTSSLSVSFQLSFANQIHAVLSYSGDIGAITGLPSGTGSNGYSSFSYNYVGNGVVDHTFTIPTNVGNFGTGLKSIYMQHVGPGHFQCSFTPAIPKTSNDRLILTFRYTFTRR